MSKMKGQGTDARYVVWKPPVRLELLALESLSIRPVRSNTLSRMMRSGRSESPGRISPDPALYADAGSGSDTFYPLSIYAHGKHGRSYTLYAHTVGERTEWRKKIREAIEARKSAQERTSIFRLETITADTALSQEAPAHQPGLVTGRVSCTLPFELRDARRFVAIGSEDGVWVGMLGRPESIQRVMSLRLVTQVAYLEEFGLLVVLADKSLYAVDIESVIPNEACVANLAQPSTTFGLKKLNSHMTVHFFSVGRSAGQTLIVYKTRRGLDSVFRILEVSGSPEAGTGTHPPLHRQDFFLPTEAHDLLFLKRNLCIMCTKGFEIMNLEGLTSVTIPVEEDMQRLGKRQASYKPLTMIRLREDEFLLCFDEFGLYMDKRGAPSRTPSVIEWEGTAVHAGWHAPYVLLFNPFFIEIRHVESGRLAQVISGHDIRCVWDGRGVISPTVVNPGNSADESEAVEDPRTPRVHTVMDNSEISPSFAAPAPSHGAPTHPGRQVVFQLMPTERLVIPGTRYASSVRSVADTLPPYVP
ncbi:CNH-domain-containing protein [Trametes gibbosa]|nr:CNH-domain-containing protein [Trametes gibbosa]